MSRTAPAAVFALLLSACGCMGCATAQASLAPSLDPFVIAGLDNPIDIAVPGDGSGRMFVAEQGGEVEVVDMGTGSVLGPAYLDIPVRYNNEQGLLAIEFDPNFGVNPALPGYGDVYVAFTAPSTDPELGEDPDQVLRRYTVSNPASDEASGATWVDVMRLPDWAANHNGADLHFGPDAYLYYSMGDGGGSGDPHNFAQSLGPTNYNGHSYYLLGKMMRIDVHQGTASPGAEMCAATPGQPAEYSIPDGNPFKGVIADPDHKIECDAIWLYGLRNPFRFSFDRASGDLWIGDVGQNAYEEVDWLPNGTISHRNLGWRLCEGFDYFNPSGSGSDCPLTTNTLAPVLVLSQGDGNRSVIGGYRYRGPVSALRGLYIYLDWGTGKIWFASYDGSHWNATQFTGYSDGYALVAFGEDTVGNLYVVNQGNGNIYRFNGSDVIFANGFET